MTEGAVRYLGAARTTDGSAPLIVHAEKEEDRKRVVSEASGGVLFTEAEDMPSLERLLEQHRISYAVLEGPPSSADDASVSEFVSGDWRDEARARLDRNVAVADRDAVMDEEYSFLAALERDALDAFLDRALGLLSDPRISNEQWEAFLEHETTITDAALSHAPVALGESVADETEGAPPTLTLADLSISFSRGAIGAPRPLSDIAER